MFPYKLSYVSSLSLIGLWPEYFYTPLKSQTNTISILNTRSFSSIHIYKIYCAFRTFIGYLKYRRATAEPATPAPLSTLA